MDILLWGTTIILMLSKLISHAYAGGYCSFPDYLWSPEVTWIGKTLYSDVTDTWDMQEEISIKDKGEIVIRVKSRAPCTQSRKRRRHQDDVVQCYEHNTMRRLICVTEERHDKFRVQVKTSGKDRFSCMKFVKRNDNVVQVFESASPSFRNEEKLCYDSNLKQLMWPWISPKLYTWQFCPSIGGFDFRAKDHHGKTLCDRIWLPSRLESECVIGDSLIFTFPENRCSPFPVRNKKEHQMQCWGQWVEDNAVFILFGAGQIPRYTLKLPLNADSYDEMSALLYLNAVVPDNTTHHDLYWSLDLLRSGPGSCYDETELCYKASESGQCTPHSTYEYAKHCRKSCGLCALAPTDDSECVFPEELQGDWVAFTEKGQQEIAIYEGSVLFSEFGTYKCKSMHWESNYYKVISSYTNGCRPRYTCMKISKGTGDTLNVQLSRSSLSDKSFELCQFQDDVLPLGNYIHSLVPKLLLPFKSMFSTSCHMDGSVHVQINTLAGGQCQGYMSDINKETCEALPTLSVDIMPSCHEPSEYEFGCVASAALDTSNIMLVTEQKAPKQDTKHICWKLEKDTGGLRAYKRVTCDSGIEYTNRSNSYNLNHRSSDGIWSIIQTSDLNPPCTNHLQDDGKYIHKQPWPDENYDSNNQKAQDKNHNHKGDSPHEGSSSKSGTSNNIKEHKNKENDPNINSYYYYVYEEDANGEWKNKHSASDNTGSMGDNGGLMLQNSLNSNSGGYSYNFSFHKKWCLTTSAFLLGWVL